MKNVIYVLFLTITLIMAACSDPPIENVPIPKITNGNEIVFPSTIIGEFSESETIELKNIGNGTLEIKSASLKLENGEYDISDVKSKVPTSLSEGQSIKFTIKFTPTQIGKKHKNILKFKIDGLEDNLELGIDAPVNAPRIKLSPRTLMFSNSNVQSFEISNSGNAILTITKDVTINSDKFNFDDNFSIPANTKLCPKDAKTDNPTCVDGNTVLPRSIVAKVNYTGTPGSSDTGSVKIFNDGEPGATVSFVGLTAATNVCHLFITNIEDDVLDFGSVYIEGAGATKNIALINTGGADCTLDSVNLVSDQADIFNLQYLDNYPEFTTPITIPSRANSSTENPNQYIFKVLFKPTAETSYTGKLTLRGSDPLWIDAKKEIPLLGQGSKATLPVAKCNPDYFEVEPAIDNPNNPISVITLNGSESFDPSGEALSYKWEKLSAPTGSVSQPRTPTSANSTYFVDLAGEHKLKLTVTNESGLSASCEVTAVGATSNALHIELFWDKNGDVDLHLKKPGTGDGAWGSNTDDCFWGNACKGGSLNWGQPGEGDNPKLDRDDITAKGPENINMDAPEITAVNNSYMVGVKNYSHRGNPTATVRIYCNGGAQFEYSMSLPDAGKSFWWVAGIEWTVNGCNINPINTVGNYPGASGTR